MISRRWNAPPQQLPEGRDKKHSASESLMISRVLMIHEELIALTGDPRTAAILGQLLYWSQKVNDFDLYVKEERTRSSKSEFFRHGWFERSIVALMEETMLNVTMVTFRRYLRFLVDRKWVHTRRNPQNRWTGARQYRVNLQKLTLDLQNKGYGLPDCSLHEKYLGSKKSHQKEMSLQGRIL